MKMLIRSLFLAVALSLPLSPAFADEVAEITLTADKVQFLFDKKEFSVKAGQKVKITLDNPAGSVQPHNLIIVKPGKKDTVGMLANQSLSDPEFLKNPVPDSEDVLFSSELVQPGTKGVLEFTAPEEPGEYPYLCTFPGHWILMNGVMTVEE